MTTVKRKSAYLEVAISGSIIQLKMNTLGLQGDDLEQNYNVRLKI